jgi:hypothetical protein
MLLRDQVKSVREVALLSMVEAATGLSRSGSFELIETTYVPLPSAPGFSTG